MITNRITEGIIPICEKCGKPVKSMIESSGDIIVNFENGPVSFYLHINCWETIMWEWFVRKQKSEEI